MDFWLHALAGFAQVDPIVLVKFRILKSSHTSLTYLMANLILVNWVVFLGGLRTSCLDW